MRPISFSTFGIFFSTFFAAQINELHFLMIFHIVIEKSEKSRTHPLFFLFFYLCRTPEKN